MTLRGYPAYRQEVRRQNKASGLIALFLVIFLIVFTFYVNKYHRLPHNPDGSLDPLPRPTQQPAGS